MKFTTLRNLMASMLVLGVAGSVIAVGNGTFALFNATTTNPSNTFSSDDLIFNNTPSGGTLCTAKASVTSGSSPSCSTLVTLSNVIPGDTTTGSVALQNGSARAGLSIKLNSAASPTSVLDSTPFATSGASGLGLLVFQCTLTGTSDRPCSGNPSGNTTLVPVYPSSTACGAGNLTTSGFDFVGSGTGADITASSTSGTLTIDTKTCTGGSIVIPTASALTIPGFSTVNASPAINTTTNVLAAGDTVHLLFVAYLPGNADDTVAAKTSTLSFNFVGTQVIGTDR